MNKVRKVTQVCDKDGLWSDSHGNWRPASERVKMEAEATDYCRRMGEGAQVVEVME